MLSCRAAFNLVAFRQHVRTPVVSPTVLFKFCVCHLRSLIGFINAYVLVTTLDADMRLIEG
jgi:hypothetical protein